MLLLQLSIGVESRVCIEMFASEQIQIFPLSSPLSPWIAALPVFRSGRGKGSTGTSHQAVAPRSRRCSLTEWPD